MDASRVALVRFLIGQFGAAGTDWKLQTTDQIIGLSCKVTKAVDGTCLACLLQPTLQLLPSVGAWVISCQEAPTSEMWHTEMIKT